MNKIITDTHAAIDRLVAHLERQATEHVHALDALRAEVEALRAQNAHLRALQAAQEGEGKTAGNLDCVAGIANDSDALKVREAKPVREVVRGTHRSHPIMREPGKLLHDSRHAFRFGKAPDWTAYRADGACVRDCLTEPEAIAWVLDGVLPAR